MFVQIEVCGHELMEQRNELAAKLCHLVGFSKGLGIMDLLSLSPYSFLVQISVLAFRYQSIILGVVHTHHVIDQLEYKTAHCNVAI